MILTYDQPLLSGSRSSILEDSEECKAFKVMKNEERLHLTVDDWIERIGYRGASLKLSAMMMIQG